MLKIPNDCLFTLDVIVAEQLHCSLHVT